jgi:hypothetical protein
MSERTLSGSIALTKLTHVMMEKKGKSGMIKGIFIPIELNHLETKDEAVYLPIRVTAKDETDSYGQNGFVAKSVKRDKKWAEMTEAEKEAEKGLTPILGNLKDFSMGGGNDASGAASATTVGEEDELPF